MTGWSLATCQACVWSPGPGAAPAPFRASSATHKTVPTADAWRVERPTLLGRRSLSPPWHTARSTRGCRRCPFASGAVAVKGVSYHHKDYAHEKVRQPGREGPEVLSLLRAGRAAFHLHQVTRGAVSVSPGRAHRPHAPNTTRPTFSLEIQSLQIEPSKKQAHRGRGIRPGGGEEMGR